MLEDVLKSCKPNPAGTGTEVLFAPKSYFDTLQKPTTTPALIEDIVTITGTHTFQTGKGFHKMQVTDMTGQVMSEAVGEIDGKSFNHSWKGFIPNNDKKNQALLSKLASCEWIFLIPEETEAGTVYRQVGSYQHPAYAKTVKYDSGVVGARRGTDFEIESVGHTTHAPFYEGTITYFP